MGVEVWQRLDRTQGHSTTSSIEPTGSDHASTQNEQVETPLRDTWSGWIQQSDSAHALVICELSAATNASDANVFDGLEQKLLHNILFAVGISLDQSNLILVQPGTPDSRDLDTGDVSLTAVSQDELTSRLPRLVAGATLVFGGSVTRWLSDVIPDSLPSTACMVPFRLQEMLYQPGHKRECWNIIKPLRSRM